MGEIPLEKLLNYISSENLIPALTVEELKKLAGDTPLESFSYYKEPTVIDDGIAQGFTCGVLVEKLGYIPLTELPNEAKNVRRGSLTLY